MGKNKNKNKNQNNQKRNVESTQAKQTPVTTEDVKMSTSEVEFNSKKERLIEKLVTEIEAFEKEKKMAETAAIKAKEDLTFIREKCEELKAERDEVKASLNEAEKNLLEAENAKEGAEKKKKEILDEVEKEKLEILAKASEEAKEAWKKQADNLKQQLDDISVREQNLQKAQLKIERDRSELDLLKEDLQEQMEFAKKLKERYAVASPSKIEELTREIDEERIKYETLSKKYSDQTQRFAELQTTVDSIKVEIGNGGDTRKSATLSTLLVALKELKEKYESLQIHHQKYKDDASVLPLEEKAAQFDMLKARYEEVERDRDRLLEQVKADRRTQKELEIIKQEVDATNALNEHLLKELESHKTALESRTGDTCPALSKVDAEVESDDFKKDIAIRTRQEQLKSLRDIVTHVKNYAGCQRDDDQLFYTDDDIRAFLAGLSVSKLMILQGMSGTGKSSLPRIFAEAISGKSCLIPVESSWRDRNELLGYYNDFNKKFNAKSFTVELYRSGKERSREIPIFIVLDEMNIARIEYYFSDFLAILQEPNKEKWLIELVASDMRTLPMDLPSSVKNKMSIEAKGIYAIWEKIEKSRKGELSQETTDEERTSLSEYLAKLSLLTGAKDLIDGRKIRVTENIWFVGTANRDESTFEISDKVYDRAQVVSLNKKGVDEKNYRATNAKFISASALNSLFETAQNGMSRNNKDLIEERLQKIDDFMTENFDLSFGNRIVNQTINFAAVFMAAGGKLETALDYQISNKIIRKVITEDNGEALLGLQDILKDYSMTQKLISKRIKELN